MPHIRIENGHAEFSNMPISRNYYFHGLHAYDLIATIRQLHERMLISGDLDQRAYDHNMELLQEMRYGPNINDNTVWLDMERGVAVYVNGQEEMEMRMMDTPQWFEMYGVHAAVPDIDVDDIMMETLIRDHQNQDTLGQNGRVVAEIINLEESTAETVPCTDDELTMSEEDQSHWDNIVANIDLSAIDADLDEQ